jgi:predicted metal-dependent phosphoesterase TrpH
MQISEANLPVNLSTTGLSLAVDSAIDLHLHTDYSDGSWALDALLDHLLQEQFGLVAVTDHDRPDTASDIQQLALDKHLPVLVGVEMTTTWKGEMTDLLCYGFAPNHNALQNLARDLLRRQLENTREVYFNLQRQGYALPTDALPAILAKPSSQQPHALAALLREHGYGLGEPSAGRIALEAGCAFETNDLAEVVDAAHRSAGVCLLAHPGRTEGWLTYDLPLLDQVRQEVPIDGLEVYHPKHTTTQTAMYEEYAQRHHPLTSAGSDSHSPENPPIRCRAEVSRALLERLAIRID